MKQFLRMMTLLGVLVLTACGSGREVETETVLEIRPLYFNTMNFFTASPLIPFDEEILLRRSLTREEIQLIFENISDGFRFGEVFFGLDEEVIKIRAFDDQNLVVTIGGSLYMLGAHFPLNRANVHGMITTSYIVEESRQFSWNTFLRWTGSHSLGTHFTLGEHFLYGDFIRIDGTTHFLSMLTYEPEAGKAHMTEMVNRLILFPVDINVITY